MDRVAWWAIVHGVAESDMTEVTKQRMRARILEATLRFKI